MWKYALPVTMAITAAAASTTVDINLASVAELDGVKGIGPAVSSRILNERQKGRFKDWNDFITRVKGIGAGSATRMASEGVVIDGVAYEHPGDAATAQVAKRTPAANRPTQ